MRNRFVSVLVAAVAVVGLTARLQAQNVTPAQLEKGLADPGAWLNYGGDYGSQRHSPLTQITPANVGQLVGAVGVPDGAARQVRGDADRPRRRDLHHRPEQLRLGDRRAHRPSALALRARPARGDGHLLRAWSTAASRVLGDRLYMNTLDAHLLAFDMKTGAVVWDVGHRRLQGGLQRHLGAAHRQGQGDRRHRRRRVRHPRLHRRLRRRHRQAGVALLDGARPGREGQRDAGRATRGSAAAARRG